MEGSIGRGRKDQALTKWPRLPRLPSFYDFIAKACALFRLMSKGKKKALKAKPADSSDGAPRKGKERKDKGKGKVATCHGCSGQHCLSLKLHRPHRPATAGCLLLCRASGSTS